MAIDFLLPIPLIMSVTSISVIGVSSMLLLLHFIVLTLSSLVLDDGLPLRICQAVLV
jgi:hypothetical protein